LLEEGAQLVDVREASEFAEGHVKGALNVPLGELTKRMGEIRTDVPVLVICLSGGRSRSAQTILKRQKWTDVRNVRGGTNAWFATRLPME
jgi:rhodanese-related sulfurtransferase